MDTATSPGEVDLIPSQQILSPRFSSPFDIGFAAVTCLLSLINNSFTIVTVLKTKKGIGKRARLFIINMSACDILMVPTLGGDLVLSSTGCLHKPIFTLKGNEDIERCTRWARTLLSIMYVSCLGISLWSLTLVALDRAFAVTKPLLYRHYVTDSKIKISIVIAWIYPIVSSLLLFGYFGLHIQPEHMLSTYHPCDILPPVFFQGVLMLHVYILTTIIFVAYIVAYIQFKKANKVINGSDKDKKRMEKERRFLTMVLATVVSLVVLWAPYQVTHNVFTINRPHTPDFVSNILQPTAYAITNCNSWLSPVLYFILNKDFRRAYITMLPRSSVQPGTDSSSS